MREDEYLDTRKQNHLRGGSGCANSGHSCLATRGPRSHVRHWHRFVSLVLPAGVVYMLSCGSFIKPIITFVSAAYFVANCDHKLAKFSFVGPPLDPITCPFQRA